MALAARVKSEVDIKQDLNQELARNFIQQKIEVINEQKKVKNNWPGGEESLAEVANPRLLIPEADEAFLGYESNYNKRDQGLV